jgi:hypothetical protein
MNKISNREKNENNFSLSKNNQLFPDRIDQRDYCCCYQKMKIQIAEG